MATASYYEAFIDAVQQFLITNLDTSTIGTGAQVTWTIGDVGMVRPETLPCGLLVPHFDTQEPYSAGIDKDTYLVPILIVSDLHEYAEPVANNNVAGGFEQPGYRTLMQYAQAVRQVLRDGGRGITLNGLIATSVLPATNFVWVQVGQKPYRAARLAFQATQRVPRTSV